MLAYVIGQLDESASNKKNHHESREYDRNQLRREELQFIILCREAHAAHKRYCQKQHRHDDVFEYVSGFGFSHFDKPALSLNSYLNQLSGLKSDGVTPSPSLKRWRNALALFISRSARSVSKMLLGATAKHCSTAASPFLNISSSS